MNKSEDIKDLAEALNKAQAIMESAKKDSSNPFFKSKYADLHSVIVAIKEPLASNGLSYTQTMESDERGDYVETTLFHVSGQWISGRQRLQISSHISGQWDSGRHRLEIFRKKDMQAVGSAITYARRYSLQAIVGLSAEDDDAEKTMSRGKPVEPPKAKSNLRDIVAKKAEALFKDPIAFQVWRTDHGLCDTLKNADDFQLARVLTALKDLEDNQ